MINTSTRGAGLWRIDAPAVLGVLAMSGLAALGMVRASMTARAVAAAALTELDRAQTRLTQVRKERHELSDALSRLREQQAAQNWKPRPVSDLNHRLAELTQAAGEAGITVEQLTPGAVTPGRSYTSVGMRLSGKGAFRSWVSLLSALRDRFPDTGVVGFRASANTEKGQGPAQFSLELLWFAAPDAPTDRK